MAMYTSNPIFISLTTTTHQPILVNFGEIALIYDEETYIQIELTNRTLIPVNMTLEEFKTLVKSALTWAHGERPAVEGK